MASQVGTATRVLWLALQWMDPASRETSDSASGTGRAGETSYELGSKGWDAGRSPVFRSAAINLSLHVVRCGRCTSLLDRDAR